MLEYVLFALVFLGVALIVAIHYDVHKKLASFHKVCKRISEMRKSAYAETYRSVRKKEFKGIMKDEKCLRAYLRLPILIGIVLVLVVCLIDSIIRKDALIIWISIIGIVVAGGAAFSDFLLFSDIFIRAEAKAFEVVNKKFKLDQKNVKVARVNKSEAATEANKTIRVIKQTSTGSTAPSTGAPVAPPRIKVSDMYKK